MTAYVSRSFMLSALLHGIVLVVVLFLMMPAKREPLIVSSVFVLFPETTATTPAVLGASLVVKPVVFIPPAIPVHVPAPLAEETDTSPESAEPSVRTPQVRRPAVVPATSERPSARTTIEQFRKQHPATPTPPSVKQQAQVRPALIDVDTVLAPTNAESSTTSAATASDIREADAYLARLLAKLRAAHQKPPGLDEGLRVRVEFSLRADGSLTEVRLLGSSGNPAFDESVLAAFWKVAGLGAPPKSLGRANRVTFRTDAGD